MSYGFKVWNNSGDLIISTEGGTTLYQESTAENGSVTTGAISGFRSTASVSIPTLGAESIVFIRPTTNVKVFAFTTQSAIIFYSTSAYVTIQYKIFRLVENISGLETGYGLNIYKSGGNELAFSSNALAARLRAILQNAGTSYSGSNLWVSASTILGKVTVAGSGTIKTVSFYWTGMNFTTGQVTTVLELMSQQLTDSPQQPYTLSSTPKWLVAEF